jgi:argininosuccinate lyase
VREVGLPFRQAHKIVAGMVQAAVKAGKGSNDLTLEMLQASAQAVLGHPLDISEEQFALALDPEYFVAVRSMAGGVAPAATAQVLDDLAWRLQADEERLAGAQQRLVQAEAARRAECAQLTVET